MIVLGTTLLKKKWKCKWKIYGTTLFNRYYLKWKSIIYVVIAVVIVYDFWKWKRHFLVNVLMSLSILDA